MATPSCQTPGSLSQSIGPVERSVVVVLVGFDDVVDGIKGVGRVVEDSLDSTRTVELDDEFCDVGSGLVPEQAPATMHMRTITAVHRRKALTGITR
ncbi:MAG: hypothetical protein KJN81_11985 [Acidimicrobiia bacterium]|nr:hypothetical protein [Acidimicrobiia bacterium]NNL29139.1 hypothetical protein [Acidimicrobiia bacterium]